MASAGGRPPRQATASVSTSNAPPRPRPPPTDTPGTSSVVTTSQVTASIHDFAASLAKEYWAAFPIQSAVAATPHCADRRLCLDPQAALAAARGSQINQFYTVLDD